MQWSNEMWTAIIIAFFVGAIVGYLILLTTNASAKKQQKLEMDLNAATQKMEEQKQQLEKHFEESANLLSTLAQDYKKLYTHLAQSSQTLLPETTAKLEFFQQAQLENAQETAAEQSETDTAEANLEQNVEEAVQTETASADDNVENQPKDYTEGSSGILKS